MWGTIITANPLFRRPHCGDADSKNMGRWSHLHIIRLQCHSFRRPQYKQMMTAWGIEHQYPIRVQSIKRPSLQCVIADLCQGQDSTTRRATGFWYLHNPVIFSLRHSRRCNIGFLAGNVEPYDYRKTLYANPKNYPLNGSLENKPTSFYANGITTIAYDPY